jgi:hypothetical protein
MKKITLYFASLIALVFLMSLSYPANAQKDRYFIVNQKLNTTDDSVVLMPGGYSLSFSGLRFSFAGKKNIFLIKSININCVDGRSFVYDSLYYRAKACSNLVIELPPQLILNAGKISQIIINYNTIDAVTTEKNSVQIYAINLTQKLEKIDLTGFESGYLSAESGRFVSTQINQIYPRN